jgi:hypothetical protein
VQVTGAALQRPQGGVGAAAINCAIIALHKTLVEKAIGTEQQ